MAQREVFPTFIYDDVANTLTVRFVVGDLPAPPDSVRWDLWLGGNAPTAEFTTAVRRNQVTTPTAWYQTDTTPPVRMRVQYQNGAWQMPGTPDPLP